MNLASVWLVAVGAVVLVGCSKADSGTPSGSSRPPNGKERGDCVAPKAAPGQAADPSAVGTCDPGLLCLSNVCVRPPPADCQAVADQLASFQLGNYAEPEERAPVVDKYKRACQKAMVSKEQGECIANARSTVAASACAPLMFPDLNTPVLAGAGDGCDGVVQVMRAYIEKTMGNLQDPQTQKMAKAIITAMKDSCEQDGWPAEFKQCIAGADDDNALNQCNAGMPPDLQQKLTKRMTDVLQQNTPQPPGTTPF